MSASMRILDIPKRPDPRLVAELGKMVTPHLSDSMERLYASGPQLRPMHKAGKLAGPAFTVKTAPGDNLLVHRALDTAKAATLSWSMPAASATTPSSASS